MKNILISAGTILFSLALLTACGGDRPLISVTLSPTAVTMDQGATQLFTAAVTGGRNSAVIWSVQEGNAGGTITTQGFYTAPAAAGHFTVVATSAADSSKLATAVVTVNFVTLSVSPATGDLEPGATQQFTATVTGSVSRNVIWSVQEGASGGSITTDGLYTAPATAGTFHVIATSAADSSRTSTVPVTVATLAVSISPRAVGLVPGGTRAFTASVAGAMDDRVNWVVQEGSSGGEITSAGLYTAPATLGEYHIVATSVAHPSVFATAKIIVGDSGFTSTGDMTQFRSDHTATLLPNGDVLLVGGWGSGKTAELFDSKSGAFRTTGEMKTDRVGHTATLLPNGKVLVTGGGSDPFGFGDWFVLDSAELYDPATGQFAPAGTMQAKRVFHSAILLANGKVLIVGGEGEFSAELYDFASGAFTPTAPMSSECSGEVVTQLIDGRVLVTGGDSAEIFDPATASFAGVGSFVRSSHTATLLDDGRVLLAGGYRFAEGSFTFYDDAQIFDPADGQFRFLAAMNNYRSEYTATRLRNGQILIAGGWANSSDSTAELFDPGSSIFWVTGSMAKPRIGHTATLLPDGRVLVAGGAEDKSAEIYTPH